MFGIYVTCLFACHQMQYCHIKIYIFDIYEGGRKEEEGRGRREECIDFRSKQFTITYVYEYIYLMTTHLVLENPAFI